MDSEDVQGHHDKAGNFGKAGEGDEGGKDDWSGEFRSRFRSIIEDVIVDQAMRRQGIAEALLKRAIEMAREAGAGGVSLTSNSQRTAANQLYQSMGFKRRETNAYSYDLK